MAMAGVELYETSSTLLMWKMSLKQYLVHLLSPFVDSSIDTVGNTVDRPRTVVVLWL